MVSMACSPKRVADIVARRGGKLNRASSVVAAAKRTIVAPDCGLKYLPRDVAFRKMRAMVKGAAIVRRELG
jgi:5-methyltetrahydropteroyltriglutamate--homocysteine methyltransferase